MSDPRNTARPATSCRGEQSGAASPCCGGAFTAQTVAGPATDARPRRLNVELLVEKLMGAMLRLDEKPSVTTGPLTELPENLQRFFVSKKPAAGSCCC